MANERGNQMEFENRAVVVTGGTGALGAAVVGALLEEGAACHVPYLYEQEALHFPHRDHPRLTFHPGTDLTDEAAVGRLYGAVAHPWASIHLAGGFAAGPVTTATKAVFQGQLDINLVTAFLCCRNAVLAMAGNTDGGRIVNVSARPGVEWRSGAGMVAYATSKAAVAALTVALAEEVVKAGILVNAVAPSIIDTSSNRKGMPNADHEAWPKPEEVARTILFLASPGNRVTRGAVVSVFGQA
jgi:NAD(P)-dependent dehydrogenase (short-subunit alcohol dehydrogenase family)